MSMQIIKRQEGQKSEIETYQSRRDDMPQIAYNSEGRITIRIPSATADTLVVLDRALSKALIRFVKNGISELPSTQSWCAECAKEFNDNLPF